MRNPGALISLARLKTADDYTFMHSVAVCALMIALARQLGLDEQQTRDAGMAGLLHDLGKAMIPLEILNKPGKLTDEEFALVKTHPEEGHKLLLEGNRRQRDDQGRLPAPSRKNRRQRLPERPEQRDDEPVRQDGRRLRRLRCHHLQPPLQGGLGPAESIKRMAEWKGHFDPAVFQAFVKSLGIYPIGSLVSLESGKLGVVIEQGEQSLLKPKVKVFFSTKSQAYIKPEVIDLARSPRKSPAARTPPSGASRMSTATGPATKPENGL
jgi:hypothetical protein